MENSSCIHRNRLDSETSWTVYKIQWMNISLSPLAVKLDPQKIPDTVGLNCFSETGEPHQGATTLLHGCNWNDHWGPRESETLTVSTFLGFHTPETWCFFRGDVICYKFWDVNRFHAFEFNICGFFPDITNKNTIFARKEIVIVGTLELVCFEIAGNI